MAAAEAGIVAPIMNADQQQQAMAAIKSNGQMQPQMQANFGAEGYLPITTQNQSLSQMVATYATNDMVSDSSYFLLFYAFL